MMALEIIINILLLTASFCILACVCIRLYIWHKVIQVELLEQSFLMDPQHTHSEADFETSPYSLPLVSCVKSHSHAVLCKSSEEQAVHGICPGVTYSFYICSPKCCPVQFKANPDYADTYLLFGWTCWALEVEVVCSPPRLM